MGLGAILVLLALLVSLIAFVYIIVLTARGWGILHTILLCTLFIECWVFMFFTAGVHYERVRQTKRAAIAYEKATKAEATTQQLRWGDYGLAGDETNAAVPLRGQLRRLTADRGRVWREVMFLQENSGQYELEVPSATADDGADEILGDAAPAAAAAPNSESLPQGLVVYAFAEDQVTDEVSQRVMPIPSFYLGEFVVTQSQAGQVTLQPTRQLLPGQLQQINSNLATSWTLYELLPLDSHRAFAATGSSPSNEEIFGHMDDAQINELFANVPEEDGRREKIVQKYLADGSQAAPDAPPEAVWSQIELKQTKEWDVDSGDTANAERSYFDQSGRSIDDRLKRGADGPVTLDPQSTASKIVVMKSEAAKPLIADGTAQEIQPVFVRPLIDYEDAFNHYYVTKHEIQEQTNVIQRESAEIQKSTQLANEMLVFRQAENSKLASDLENFEKELEFANGLSATAKQQLSELTAEMSRLYNSIQSSRAALTSRQTSLLATP